MRVRLTLGCLAAVLTTTGALAAPAASPIATPIPVPPPAPPAPAKVNPTPASRALALQLAEVMNSEALTRKQIDHAYTVTMPAVLRSDPQFQAMEQIYPGITAVAIKAEREIIEGNALTRLPEAHRFLAERYAQYLEAAELAELLAFYRGPIGQKAILAVGENTDISESLAKNLEDPFREITRDEIGAATMRKSAPKFFSSLSPDEFRELLRFGATPAARRLRAAQPLVLGEFAKYVNELNREVVPRAQQNVAKAVGAFVATKDGKAIAK